MNSQSARFDRQCDPPNIFSGHFLPPPPKTFLEASLLRSTTGKSSQCAELYSVYYITEL